MIGPWRDPISGRWIVQKPPLARIEERVLENSELALALQLKNKHIWRALEASAEASQISSEAKPMIDIFRPADGPNE